MVLLKNHFFILAKFWQYLLNISSNSSILRKDVYSFITNETLLSSKQFDFGSLFRKIQEVKKGSYK